LVRARALNAIGWSTLSAPNSSGATIQTKPTLMNDPVEGAATSASKIVLTWAALVTADETGASAITSYSLEWNQGTAGAWVSLLGDPTPSTALTH